MVGPNPAAGRHQDVPEGKVGTVIAAPHVDEDGDLTVKAEFRQEDGHSRRGDANFIPPSELRLSAPSS